MQAVVLLDAVRAFNGPGFVPGMASRGMQMPRQENDMSAPTEIEVYSVGLLFDLKHLHAALRHPAHGMTRRNHLRAFGRRVAGSWRRRSYWNGYLAEVHYPPAGLMHRTCGTGWTRKAAARSLGLRLWEDNRA